MKEILFKAKRKNSEEWVKGYYIGCIAGCYFLLTQDREEVLIDVETLSQYTGLKDVNGVKIFEGDILSERPPMNETAYIGYVAYDEESAVWRFMIKNDTKYNGVLLGSYSRSYKVIGNRFDNPELRC